MCLFFGILNSSLAIHSGIRVSGIVSSFEFRHSSCRYFRQSGATSTKNAHSKQYRANIGVFLTTRRRPHTTCPLSTGAACPDQLEMSGGSLFEVLTP